MPPLIMAIGVADAGPKATKPSSAIHHRNTQQTFLCGSAIGNADPSPQVHSSSESLLASSSLSTLHNHMEQTSPNDGTVTIYDNITIDSTSASTPLQGGLEAICSEILNLSPLDRLLAHRGRRRHHGLSHFSSARLMQQDLEHPTISSLTPRIPVPTTRRNQTCQSLRLLWHFNCGNQHENTTIAYRTGTINRQFSYSPINVDHTQQYTRCLKGWSTSSMIAVPAIAPGCNG